MLATADVSDLRALARDEHAHADFVPTRAETIVALTGHSVVADAQVFAPVDLGALRNSIGVDVDGLSFEAGPTVEYGGYVEEGTDPHAIPNAFGWGDDFGTDPAFHPGTAPQPYMGPAFDRHLPRAIDAVADLGEGIV